MGKILSTQFVNTTLLDENIQKETDTETRKSVYVLQLRSMMAVKMNNILQSLPSNHLKALPLASIFLEQKA